MKRKPRPTKKQTQIRRWSQELAGFIRANRSSISPDLVLWRHVGGKVSLVPKTTAFDRWQEYRAELPFGHDSMPPGAIGAVICTESGARWAVVTVEEIQGICAAPAT